MHLMQAADLNRQLVVAATAGAHARAAALMNRGASCDATHALGDPKGAGRSAVYWAVCGEHLAQREGTTHLARYHATL